MLGDMLKIELQNLLKETEKLDFPFFSSYNKRSEILHEKRLEFDAKIDGILSAHADNSGKIVLNRCDIWKQADDEARKEFGKLSEKDMMNGFYFQEVMHCYVDLQISVIMDFKKEQ